MIKEPPALKTTRGWTHFGGLLYVGLAVRSCAVEPSIMMERPKIKKNLGPTRQLYGSVQWEGKATGLGTPWDQGLTAIGPRYTAANMMTRVTAETTN